MRKAFRLDGRVHVDGGAYIGTGVVARGVTLDAHVQADPYELRITDIVARFRQGGQMEGIVDLKNWLPPSQNAPHLRAGSAALHADLFQPRSPSSPPMRRSPWTEK